MASSTSNHNIVINIEARNKAQSEINGAKNSMNDLDRSAKGVKGSVRDAGGETQSFGSKSQSLLSKVGNAWNNTANAMSSYGGKHKAVTAGAVAGFMDMAKTSSDYGTTLVGITKMSDDSKLAGLGQAEAVDVVSKAVDELASSYQNMSKQEIANQFLDISRAGYGLSDAMKISDAGMKLATASGEDLEGVTGILIRSMGAFGLGAKDAGEMARVLAGSANASTSDVSDMIPALNMVGATAHASGVSFEETANAIAFMHAKGVQASTGARGLRTMLVNMADGANEGTEALNELGWEMDDNGLKYDSLTDLIQKYKKYTADLSDEQKRNIAVQLGGKEAMASVLTLMSEADVAYDEHGNKISSAIDDYDAFSKEVSEFTNEDLEDLKNSMQDADPWSRFKAQLDNAKISLSQALAPAIEQVLEKLIDFLTKLQDPEYAEHVAKIIEMGAKYLVFANIVGTVGSAMGVISGVFSAVGTVISGVGTVVGALTGAFTTLSGGAGVLATALGFIASPVGIITVAIGGLATVVLSTWDTNKTFGENMQAIWSKIVDFVKHPIDSINNMLQSFGDKMGGLVDKVKSSWEKITGFFKVGSKNSADSTKKMSGDVDKNTTDATKSAEKGGKGISKGVGDGTKKASDSASKDTAKIKTDVSKNLSDASNESMKQGQEIAKGLSKGMEDASNSVSKSLDKITTSINTGTTNWSSAFGKGMGNLKSTTESNMKSVQSSMTSGMNSIEKTASNGGKRASNGFKSGIRPMPREARSIAYETGSTLRSSLGSIDLYYTGSRVMGTFASGLRSQLSSIASISYRASSLARPRSMQADELAYDYVDSEGGVLLSTLGVQSVGAVSNPMGISNKNLSIVNNTSTNDEGSEPQVNITIYESFDGDKITRRVNSTNARAMVRMRTGKE